MAQNARTLPALSPSDELIPVARARFLLGRNGKPIARPTVLSFGLRGDLDVREVAGRFVVTRASIDAFRIRFGIDD